MDDNIYASSFEVGRNVSIESAVEVDESEEDEASSSWATVSGSGDGRGAESGFSLIFGNARKRSDMFDSE